MEIVKITSNGRITLPNRIKEALSLANGDTVAFIKKDGQYILVNPKKIKTQ